MKSSNFAVCFAGLCFLVLLHSIPCSAAVSANVPLDSWVYPALDKLVGLKLIDSSLQGSRPYTRLEAVRQTLEARGRLEAGSYPAVAGELLRRLETELRAELNEMAMQAQRPLPRFTLERRGGSSKEGGTTFLPYALFNKGAEPAEFEIAASPRGVLFYADTDGNGRPDGPSPLSGGVKLAGGESYTFVLAVPPGTVDSTTITVTAANTPVPKQPLLRFVPLRELRLDYIFQQGEDSPFPANAAHQFAPNYNNFGIAYREHHNAQAILESEARLGRYFLLNLRPLLALQEGGGASMRLLQGEAALGLGPLELSAGRQSLWWGPGRHGSLVLTNNTKPLDMVRLTNPVPATLPWIFEYLGPFRFDLFLSRLEDDRVVPEPYFGGLRFNIKPAKWLELGASRGVMFGGKGRPDIKFDDFLTIIGGENLSGEGDTSNSVASFDARLKLPFLAGAELYAEMGGEDEGDLLGFIPFPSKKALLTGLYLPRIEPTGRLGLRLEYADLNYEGNGPVWYRHGLYPYTYEKKILGHHAGGDARDFYAELQCFLPHDVTATAAYDRQKRGVSDNVQEEHDQPSLELRWAPTTKLELHARYAYDRVRNFGFVDGEDREFHFLTTGASIRW